MKKGTLIIGQRNSGKTSKATEIASDYNADQVVWLSNLKTDQGPFYFVDCNRSTSLVIIDEVRQVQQIENLLLIVRHGIQVNKPGQLPFKIAPQFILVCSPMIEAEDLPCHRFFHETFNIVQC